MTKCCPANKVLDLSLNRCVITSQDIIHTDLFPPARMIRDVDSGLSTGHYHLNTYEGQPWCEIFVFFSSRSLETRDKYISFIQLVNVKNHTCEFYHSKLKSKGTSLEKYAN